jgi:hypothetical protein
MLAEKKRAGEGGGELAGGACKAWRRITNEQQQQQNKM